MSQQRGETRTPGFTALAVVTLALSLGITTVVFTIYGSVAFRRLGHATEDRHHGRRDG